MRNALIAALEDMMNGDAVSDINAFNDFVRDFLEYMDWNYGMESSEVMEECGLLPTRDRR